MPKGNKNIVHDEQIWRDHIKVCKIKINFADIIDFRSNNYIEDDLLVIFLTPRHNCDVIKDSDQSNHTIVNLFRVL